MQPFGYVRPDDLPSAVGLLARGDRVVATGRSDDGAWLEIRSPLLVTARAWVPAAAFTGDPLTGDVDDLPVQDCGPAITTTTLAPETTTTESTTTSTSSTTSTTSTTSTPLPPETTTVPPTTAPPTTITTTTSTTTTSTTSSTATTATTTPVVPP